VKLIAANRLKRAWRCPNDGWTPPRGDLDVEPWLDEQTARDRRRAIETVRQVERITKVKCQTCPRWYAAQDEVHRAVDQWRWRKERALHVVESEITSRTKVAMDVIDDAFSETRRYLEKKNKER